MPLGLGMLPVWVVRNRLQFLHQRVPFGLGYAGQALHDFLEVKLGWAATAGWFFGSASFAPVAVRVFLDGYNATRRRLPGAWLSLLQLICRVESEVRATGPSVCKLREAIHMRG